MTSFSVVVVVFFPSRFASGKAALPEGLEINAVSGSVTSPVMIAGQGSYTTLMVVTDAAGATNQTTVTFAIDGDNTMGGCSFFPGVCTHPSVSVNIK